jgi:hypothetical protein
MDGEVLTTQLDGRALPVDPGMHDFSFNVEGGAVISQRIMIVEGQRNQPISVSINARDKQAQKRTLAPTVALPPTTDAKTAVEKAPVDRSLEEPGEKRRRDRPAVEKSPRENAVDESDSTEIAAEPEIHRSNGPGPGPYLLAGAGIAGIGTFGLLTYWGKKDNDLLTQCSPDCSPASVDRVRKLYLMADISLGVGVAALGSGILWLAMGSKKEKGPAQSAYSVDVKPTPAGAFATVSGTF